MSNSIHRCPNCFYALVLLERRSKYKCAKCGKLFPQKDIETESFRNWNEKQREVDKENIKTKRPKLSEEEKSIRTSENSRSWRLRNIEKVRTNNNERWHNGTRKEYSKELYRRNLAQSRLLRRIKYYRIRQKELTLKALENIEEKAYNTSIFISPPTSAPYQLLKI